MLHLCVAKSKNWIDHVHVDNNFKICSQGKLNYNQPGPVAQIGNIAQMGNVMPN